MIKEVIASGKDLAEAQENARLALGAGPLDDVQYDVVYLGKKGFLGFMSKPAQVRAYIETNDGEDSNSEKRRRPSRDKRQNRQKGNSNKNENRKEIKKEKTHESAKAPIVTQESNLKFDTIRRNSIVCVSKRSTRVNFLTVCPFTSPFFCA